MALAGFTLAAGNRPRKAWVEPRMLMKIKQLSEETRRCSDPSQETKCLKLSRLSILSVGYYKAEKNSENEGISQNVIENKRPKMDRWGRSQNVYENKQLIVRNPECL